MNLPVDPSYLGSNILSVTISSREACWMEGETKV